MSKSAQSSKQRSLKGSNNFNISSNHQNGSSAMDEDFELTIKANRTTKQNNIDDIENIPITENVTMMEVDQDPEGEIEENNDSAADYNNNEAKLNLEQALEENPCEAVDNKDELEAQSDGNSDILFTNYRNDLANMGLRPGVVVWAKSGEKWWPGIMEKIKSEAVTKKRIHVRYLNYKGLKGIIAMKNLFPFKSHEENWKEFKDNRKIDRKSIDKLTSPKVARAEKEAEIFMTFEEDDRLEILEIIVQLQTGLTCKQTIKVDIKASDAVPSHLEDFLQKYIDEIKVYDDLVQEQMAKSLEIKAQRAESKPSTSSKESSVERVPERPSGARLRIAKRDFSITSVESTSNNALPPPPKKQRQASSVSIDKNIPIEERFKFCPNDISSLFKNAQTEKICMECCERETEDMKVYKCKKCPNYYHEKCGHQSEASKELTCKGCSSEDKYCFSCKEVVEDKFICGNSDCKQIYHKSCIEMSPNFNENSGVCPLHSCHTCKWKFTNRNGSIVKCIKCPVAYHANIYCLPAGSQVISKDEILCPRHKTPDEEQLKTLHIKFCIICNDSGKVVNCDTCPISIHKTCISEDSRTDPNVDKFICDDCRRGSMPLYNTVVWAKVGQYRWWPCYVMTPQQSETKSSRKSDRQFCVMFFGTHEHCWVTHDRVYGYNLQEEESKAGTSKKNIDGKFEKAIVEANKIRKLLDDNIEDDESAEPTPFRKISQNRPVHPVILKKAIVDEDEKCSCKPDDPSPCGNNSGCIVRITKYECSKLCPAGDKCQNQKLRNQDYDFIKLCKTKNRGYGAFAKKDIPKNTVVCEYVGELINLQEFKRRAAEKQARGDRDYYFMTYDKDLIVDAEPAGNLSRFLNHSCDPNCEIIKIIVDGIIRLGIFSNYDIPIGTELTFNYMFDVNEYGKVRCLCGTSKCAGFIGGKEKIEQNGPKKKKKVQFSSTIVKVPSKSTSVVSENMDIPPEDE